MADTQVERKEMGRNQRLASRAYSLVGGTVVVPAIGIMMSATFSGDTATQLAVLDRLIKFANEYGLWAVGSILVVSGAIKGLGAVAGAVQAGVAAKKGQ